MRFLVVLSFFFIPFTALAQNEASSNIDFGDIDAIKTTAEVVESCDSSVSDPKLSNKSSDGTSDGGSCDREIVSGTICNWEPARANGSAASCNNSWPDNGDSLGGMVEYAHSGMWDGEQVGRNLSGGAKSVAKQRAIANYGNGNCQDGSAPLMMESPVLYYATLDCSMAYNRRYSDYGAADVNASDWEAIANSSVPISQAPANPMTGPLDENGNPTFSYPAMEAILQACMDLGIHWTSSYPSAQAAAQFYYNFQDTNTTDDQRPDHRFITHCNAMATVQGQYCCG